MSEQQQAPICAHCGHPCGVDNGSFGYPGTHCNYGNAGTYNPHSYTSACCGAQIQPATQGEEAHPLTHDLDPEGE